MIHHTVHKLFVVMVLLAIFAAPFYLQRGRISSVSENARLIGTILTQTSLPSGDHNSPSASVDSHTDSWGHSVGTSFVGSNSHLAQ